MSDPEIPEALEARTLLRGIRLLAELPDEDLDRLAAAAHRMRVPPGTLLMREGDPGDALYLVLGGEVEVFHQDPGGDEVPLATVGPGSFVGEMALLGRARRTASVRTLVESDLLVLGPDAFHDLLESSPTASLTILRTVGTRLRNTERTLLERERLATLGTLTAGLAHELNNPSAALLRTAEHLERRIGSWGQRAVALGRFRLEGEARQVVDALEEALAHPDPSEEGPPDRARDREVERWLEAAGIGRSGDLAPVLGGAGWTAERLGGLAETVGEEATPAVVAWLAAGLELRALAGELRTSAQAISSVVAAVRLYSHQEREAGLGTVSVEETLRHALTLLHHKLRRGIDVESALEQALPPLLGNAAELGRLWMILIDNAVDAMDGHGRLRLAATRDASALVVDVEDEGPGIPEGTIPRLFDPFFTTKPPGKGTGLGLAIAKRIAEDHGGRIEVDSRPGSTRFRVRLPLPTGRETAAPGTGPTPPEGDGRTRGEPVG